MNRRNLLIKGIGLAIISGLSPSFLPELLPEHGGLEVWLDGVKLQAGDDFLQSDGDWGYGIKTLTNHDILHLQKLAS